MAKSIVPPCVGKVISPIITAIIKVMTLMKAIPNSIFDNLFF